MIEGFGQQEFAGPFGRSKWPLSYCLKHVKGASRTQTGSDCSRPSWGAPRAADLGFGLGLQVWGRPVPVKSRPVSAPWVWFLWRLRLDGPPSRSTVWSPRVRAAAVGGRMQQGPEAGSFRRGVDWRWWFSRARVSSRRSRRRVSNACFPGTGAAMSDLRASPKVRSVV